MTVLGAILAGGQSRRFGNDKALALFAGRPLIEHVIAALQPMVDAVVVVGRGHPQLPSAADRPAGSHGPLAGLAGALAYAQGHGHDAVLTIGVDSIGISPDLHRRLAPAPAYVADQPIIGLWPVTALAALDQLWESDLSHSMLSFIGRIGARAVTLDCSPANINTAADLARLEQMP